MWWFNARRQSTCKIQIYGLFSWDIIVRVYFGVSSEFLQGIPLYYYGKQFEFTTRKSVADRILALYTYSGETATCVLLEMLAAYVDLKKAFNSVNLEAVLDHLLQHEFAAKTID